MATVVHQRHHGGRPRTAKRSPTFYLIDDLAARRGITIKELAASAGIARDTFYKIHDPKLSILKGLADALGIPVSRLASRVAAVESETA